MQRGAIIAAFAAAAAAVSTATPPAQLAAGAPCSLVVVGATATDGKMYALNASDGRRVWAQYAGNGPSVEHGYGSGTGKAAFAYINGTAAVVAG